MIYESVLPDSAIRQGDIIGPLPVPLLNLEQLYVPTKDGYVLRTWEEVLSEKEMIVEVTIQSLLGIVASQDCDVLRSPLVSLFAIDDFESVTRLTPAKNPKKWASLITKQSRENAGWFYLPPDELVGFTNKMAVDFDRVFQVQRDDLESKLARLRKGRLIKVAYEHYRERIAQYYRRFPYDEWYPLDREEFDAYNESKGPVEPFPWQEVK